MESQDPTGEALRIADYASGQDLRSTAPSSHSASSNVSGGDINNVIFEVNSPPAPFRPRVGFSRLNSPHCSGDSASITNSSPSLSVPGLTLTPSPEIFEVSDEDFCEMDSQEYSAISIDSGYYTDKTGEHRQKKACESCKKRKWTCEHQNETAPQKPSQEDVSQTKLDISLRPEVGKRFALQLDDLRVVNSDGMVHSIDSTRPDDGAPESPSASKFTASANATNERCSTKEAGSPSERSDSVISNILEGGDTNLFTAVTAGNSGFLVRASGQPLPSPKDMLAQTWITTNMPETTGKSGPAEYPPQNCQALSVNIDWEFAKDKREQEERSLTPESNIRQPSEDSPGNTTGSGDTELVEDDEELVLVLAKHRLLIKYMQDFYSMFSPSYGAFVECGQGETNSTTSKSPARSEVSNQGQYTKSKGQKRKAGDRESTPPDDDKEGTRKKRGRNDPTRDGDKSNRLFACPFYKFDPSKYGCTNMTGSKYRTCAGPGFHNIARLKQHLKRTHSMPQFLCLRCWQTFPDHRTLAAHLQEEIRCPKLDEPPMEGITQLRWDMIKSRWGASWGNIYEILFPGAPIPSPYFEVEAGTDLPHQPSPSSQQAADYEVYQRTELPRIVEAMLEAMIQARTDPLEEKYKPFFLEIVRGAQSSLNQRWEMRKAQVAPSRASQPPSQAATNHILPSDSQSVSNSTAVQPATPNTNSSLVPPTYEIPPPLGGLAEMASWELLQETQNLASLPLQFAYSDSGYGSQMSERWCQCGSFIDLSFGGPQDSIGYSSSSNSNSQTMPSLNQPLYPEGSHSLDSSSTLESPREKTVVRCSFCGSWRFKQ